MKPEQSERILVEELFKKTISKNLLKDDVVENIEKLTGEDNFDSWYECIMDLQYGRGWPAHQLFRPTGSSLEWSN